MNVECDSGEVFNIDRLWSRPRTGGEWAAAFGISLRSWWRLEPELKVRRCGSMRRIRLSDCPPAVIFSDLGVRPVAIVPDRASIATERI